MRTARKGEGGSRLRREMRPQRERSRRDDSGRAAEQLHVKARILHHVEIAWAVHPKVSWLDFRFWL